MFNSTGEWFPNDLKLIFDFEEENTENQTIIQSWKITMDPNWSRPYQFEFNFYARNCIVFINIFLVIKKY